jgi:hypothetical protein
VAKKKTGLSSTLFRGIDPYAGDLEEPVAAAGRLPIEAIRPDPGQPRRLLPPELAGALASGELGPREVMKAWLESGGLGTPQLQALEQLAESVSRHGLINPVSVRRPRDGETLPDSVSYLVVTGERRYWAHVLLAVSGRRVGGKDEGHDPETIQALVLGDEVSIRAHQLIENIMREDINAVEKARGLWALRYELSGLHGNWVNDDLPLAEGSAEGEEEVNYRSPVGERGVNKSSMKGEGSPESDEVNDNSPLGEPSPSPVRLVPWNRVAEELSISKRYRIFLTQVLTLSLEAQAIVQEHGLAETTIRPIVQKLRGEPQLQLAALQQLVAWQQENEMEGGERRAITRGVDELVERLLQQKSAGTGRPDVARAANAIDAEAQTRRFRRRIRGAIHFLHRLPRPELALLARDLALDTNYADVVDDMHALRDQIDELLQRVDQYRSEK